MVMKTQPPSKSDRDDDSVEPIVCDLSAIPARQRVQHFLLARSLLFADERRVRELENGLEFELPPDRLGQAVRFVENERRCCRHLAFALEVPARGAPIILRVTGPGASHELRALAALAYPERRVGSMFTALLRCLPRPRSMAAAAILIVTVVALTSYAWSNRPQAIRAGATSLAVFLACALPCAAPLALARLGIKRKRERGEPMSPGPR